MKATLQRLLKKVSGQQAGFTLIECVIAMVITMIGVLATVALMAVGVRMQVVARDSTAGNAYARAKIEQLQNYSHTATQRCPPAVGASCGSTTSDVTNYNDVVDGRYRRRWLIENSSVTGVPANTQRITVVVTPDIPGVLMPDVSVVALVSGS